MMRSNKNSATKPSAIPGLYAKRILEWNGIVTMRDNKRQQGEYYFYISMIFNCIPLLIVIYNCLEFGVLRGAVMLAARHRAGVAGDAGLDGGAGGWGSTGKAAPTTGSASRRTGERAGQPVPSLDHRQVHYCVESSP
jgi:hypothetical protein